MDFEKLAGDYVPKAWKEITADFKMDIWFEAIDYVMMRNYVASYYGEEEFIAGGIHEAMDLTLPGIISTESINNGSVWLDVPDSRDW